MRILISNDDGYRAEGLLCLADTLRDIAGITVVAPDRNRSGASNSLTLEVPLRVRQEASDMYSVNGTPTDCVHLAITGFLDHDPDMVVSGINEGANLGDDVIYSGTVAAAMEGRFLGLPAIAVSLVGHRLSYYSTAARVAASLVARIASDPLPGDTILNVNVPDLPDSALRGYQATRLGYRHRAEPAFKTTDPKNRTIWWVGPAGPEQDAGPGTDFYAVNNGFVSVTPLKVDLTSHPAIDGIAAWLDDLN